MTDDRDTTQRDMTIHIAIDNLAHKISATFGLSWRDTLERLVAYVENDEAAPQLFQPAPPARPKRRRKAVAEVHA